MAKIRYMSKSNLRVSTQVDSSNLNRLLVRMGQYRQLLKIIIEAILM